MNTSLLNHVKAEAIRLRERGGSHAAFVADQLERVAQLIIFTGAETPEQYDDRVFANEEAVAEQHFERGYQEGRNRWPTSPSTPTTSQPSASPARPAAHGRAGGITQKEIPVMGKRSSRKPRPAGWAAGRR